MALLGFILLAIVSSLVLAAADLELVWDESFSTLDKSKWEHEVTLSGGKHWGFHAFTPDPQNSYVQDNTLYIKPTLTADKHGEAFLTSGVWDLPKEYQVCTDSFHYGCSRTGSQDNILNPVMSAKLKSKIGIRYGRVEIQAKLPKGDWLWPSITMMPAKERYGAWPLSGEMDIAESRGNIKYNTNRGAILGAEQVTSTLHWGAIPEQSEWTHTTHSHSARQGETFADGFHNYTMDWNKDGIKIYVDSVLTLNAPTPRQGYYASKVNFHGARNPWVGGDTDAPFDQPFILTLDVAVGDTGRDSFFPDGILSNGRRKPWSNRSTKGPKEFWDGRYEWAPTWNGDDAAMQIKSLKMWREV